MTSGELLVFFFLFVLAAVSAAGYVFVLRPAKAAEEGPEIPEEISLEAAALHGPQARLAGIFRLIGEAIPGTGKQTGKTRELLAAAGYRWPSAVSVFAGIKCAAALLMSAAGLGASIAVRGDLSGAFPAALCGVFLGYLIPNQVLEKLALRRANRLRRALPAALDLMVLAVEAGQGIDAVILDTSRGLRISHPDLATEFTQLHLELRANTSRAEALRNLGARSRDLEVRKLAALLIDTDRFGTSLGPALRTHAKYLRTRFRQSAQERARKVAVKLVFPVFFLIFPSVVLVTLGPAVILIFTQLRGLLGG